MRDACGERRDEGPPDDDVEKKRKFEENRKSHYKLGGGLAQGIEHVMSELNRRLIHFKLETVRPDMTWGAGIHSYGAYAITGTPPWSDAGKPASVAKIFLDAGAALGTTVAQRLGSR